MAKQSSLCCFIISDEEKKCFIATTSNWQIFSPSPKTNNSFNDFFDPKNFDCSLVLSSISLRHKLHLYGQQQ
jgi:hypothetical protein